MICQSCNEKDANVHITKVVNGVKYELHLCEECARQKQELNIASALSFGPALSFQNILDGFVEMMGSSSQHHFEEERCETCGMTFESIRRTGRVGCGNCYTKFSRNLTPLIRRIHGNLQHTGKLPKRAGGVLRLKRTIDNLKNELKAAIEGEEYERAAKLRDEIRDLESKLKDQESRG